MAKRKQATARTRTGSVARQKRPRRNKSPDAIALLKADHRQVAAWFARFAKSRAPGLQADLAHKICAALKVLSEMIRHHVKEEEQPGGMFAEARKADMDLQALGQKMLARKTQLA
jgi:hypothetical protein